jgi:hypothetical protein
MFTLYIKEKGEKNLPNTITFKTQKQIKNFIRNISTQDLEKKEYTFLRNNDIELFFYENYQMSFYTILATGVRLNKMPNGMRREKKYDKKSEFNNRTLNRALSKIAEHLRKDEIRLNRGSFNGDRMHKMTFYFTENNMPNGYADVIFDKLLWEHKIEYIETKNPDHYITLIRNAFRFHTSATRTVRRRLYGNQP